MEKSITILLTGYLIENDLLHDFHQEMYKVQQAGKENHPNVQKAADYLVNELEQEVLI